jgi:predicted RNA binding protein YcfA (HicA-like mRNA interferase family)
MFRAFSVRMSRRRKLLEKLMAGNQDKAFSFDEAELLLLQAGFILDGGEGSHRVYRHTDGRKMVLPFHGKNIKPAYIREIRKLLK